MLKKLFSLLLLTLGLLWLDACCGDYKPYFDYKKLDIISDLLVLTAANDTVVTLRVSPGDVDYLAMRMPVFSAPAYGNSCPLPGEEGPKFSMTAIEISADKAFNDTLPAGAALNSIFYDARVSGATKTIAETGITGLDFPAPEWDFVLYTPARPKNLSESFVVTVKITKSDGTTVQGKVGPVKFK